MSHDVVLLVCNNEFIYKLSLSSKTFKQFQVEQLLPERIFKVIMRVTFDAQTDTVLIFQYVKDLSKQNHPYWYQLVSLSTNTNNFVEFSHFEIKLIKPYLVGELKVCDSKLLINGKQSDSLGVFSLDKEHIIKLLGTLQLSEMSRIHSFACTRIDDVIFVALTDGKFVYVFQIHIIEKAITSRFITK